MLRDTESRERTTSTPKDIKLVNPIRRLPTVVERTQKLRDLEIGDCFRFFDGISYEDALKTSGQSFFFVTASCGPKPPEDKVSCMTFDMKQHRVLDGDRMVIKHEVNAAIAPASLMEIANPMELSDESDGA